METVGGYDNGIAKNIVDLANEKNIGTLPIEFHVVLTKAHHAKTKKFYHLSFSVGKKGYEYFAHIMRD